MRKIFLLVIFIIETLLTNAQTFTAGGGNAGTFGNSVTFNNPTTGLSGVLDGVNLGLESVEITLNASSINKLKLYLIAPDGTRVVLSDSRAGSAGINGTITFSMNPSAGRFRDWTASNPIPSAPFKPDVSLFGFSNGMDPNGTWKLQAGVSFYGNDANISEWKLNFGSTNIAKAEPNDECVNATPLAENVALTEINTQNYSSNINDVRGQNVCASSGDYTENTAWYSFVPICKNDKITIENSDNTGAQIGIRSNCSSGSSNVSCKKMNAQTGGEIYNFNITNFIPGQKYYIVVDGDNSSYVYLKKLLWQKGTDCPVPPTPTITTANPAEQNFCNTNTFNVAYTVTSPLNSDNTFTAQLSNENGTFANPQNIGSFNSSAAGTIACTLPDNIIGSSNYKVRVISSSPVVIGAENPVKFPIYKLPAKPIEIIGDLNPCENATNVLYSVAKVPGATSYLWSIGNAKPFTLANGSTDSSQIRITDIGKNAFIIGVQARNRCGATAVYGKTITPVSLPSTPVLISNNPIIACEGKEAVELKVTPVADSKITWQFPTGTLPSSSNIDSTDLKIKIGNTGGSINVKATNKCGISPQVAIQLNVRKIPSKPAAIIYNGAICDKDKFGVFTFNLPPASIGDKYSWILAQGMKIVESSPDSSQVKISPEGIPLNIKVTAVNECGKSESLNQLFPYVSNPNPPTAINPQEQHCDASPRTPITFNITGLPNLTYQWTTPNGTQIVSSNADSTIVQVLAENNTNTIAASVKARNSCGLSATATNFMHQYITTAPPQLSIVTDRLVVCAQSDVNFKATTTNGGSDATYQWFVNDVPQLNNQSDTFTLIGITQTSTIKCIITSTLACIQPKQTSESVVIEINTVPNPTIKIVASSLEICKGAEAIVGAQIADYNTINSVNWFVNNTLQSGQNQNSLTIPNLATTATVYAEANVSDLCGTIRNIVSPNIEIKALDSFTPTISINATEQGEICADQDITITALAANTGNLVEYQWIINGNVVLKDTSVYIIPTANIGLYSVSATIITSSDCATQSETTSNTIEINLKTVPAPPTIIDNSLSKCVGDEIIFSSIANTNLIYNWIVSSELEQILLADTAVKLRTTTPYEGLVQLLASNECGASDTTSIKLKISNCNAVFIPNILSASSNDVWEIEGLDTYPNMDLQVFNRWGEKVHENKGAYLPWNGYCNGTKLPLGTYYFQLSLNDGTGKTITGSITVLK